ncbi:serine hydrolase domain-containing protein [Streptomyces sp. RerS4]|uniref:serine hydrolase domain-containing protein n=1 Tax=Streptomyces sp. RerS4 TaxID=2942449 RepID=UPI00201C6D1A|nr:serine hydrolase domain-containing protein [Streptomyces sp. RerS4]UQX02125.1 beta-lactamase family protein [Streptomyces sp. RerS4]
MKLQETVDALVASGAEGGVQVAAYLHGRPLVEAYAGVPGPDTLIHGFSTGKGCTATLVHVLAARGLIDYDAPIARYWPRFGAHGKAGITVRHALTHSAGIPHLPRSVTAAELCDWEHMCGVVAGLRPLWEPGAGSGYHGWTFGWILGETVRRVTGLTPGQALREYVAEPLGIADELYFGLPASELPRVAPLVEGGWETYLAGLPTIAPFTRLIAPNRSLWTTAGLANHPRYLRADLPSCGTMTARAAARMYAALLGEVDGVRLLPPDRLAAAAATAVDGRDRMLLVRYAKGLGYFLGMTPMGGEPTAFGHHGSGGSIAFADRRRGLSFAFIHTHLVAPANPTARKLADAVRATAEEAPTRG